MFTLALKYTEMHYVSMLIHVHVYIHVHKQTHFTLSGIFPPGVSFFIYFILKHTHTHIYVVCNFDLQRSLLLYYGVLSIVWSVLQRIVFTDQSQHHYSVSPLRKCHSAWQTLLSWSLNVLWISRAANCKPIHLLDSWKMKYVEFKFYMLIYGFP